MLTMAASRGFTPTRYLGPCRYRTLVHFSYLALKSIIRNSPFSSLKKNSQSFVICCPPRLLESIRAVTLPDE